MHEEGLVHTARAKCYNNTVNDGGVSQRAFSDDQAVGVVVDVREADAVCARAENADAAGACA
jgi:hypothetical protein